MFILELTPDPFFPVLPSLDAALNCCTALLDHLGVYWSQPANRLPNLSRDGKGQVAAFADAW
jgi:hypothetical protein